MSYVKLTDENFEQEVLKSDIPVLVDFWAEWCVPCKMLGPIIEELAGEYAGKVKICKLDVDDAPESAGKFSVQSIPTVMVFNKGEQVRQTLGAQPKDAIVKLFADLI
ncbi:MAG: thioredoxin [Spirochaetaceae bacterium]|jgi:thioredoxin 1|nr:thioredoxin [Spirochaetaceae bacterium]